jgi:hypothetical protein
MALAASLHAIGDAVAVGRVKRPQLQRQGAAQVVGGTGVLDAIDAQADGGLASVESGAAHEAGLHEGFDEGEVGVIQHLVELAITAGGEDQHHVVPGLAGGRAGGGEGTDPGRAAGIQGTHGQFGNLGGTDGLAVEGGFTGPQLECPFVVGSFFRVGHQEFGVELNAVSVEGVAVVETDPDCAGGLAGGGLEGVGGVHPEMYPACARGAILRARALQRQSIGD